MNFVNYSNQTDNLAEVLQKLLIEKPLPFFERELIIIQSANLEQYLSIKFAQKNGICSGIYFSFPSRFLKEVFSLKPSVLFPFDINKMTWLIWKTLLSFSKEQKKLLPSFIQTYFFNNLSNTKDLSAYYFANHMAKLYSRYLLYAPELINQWQQNIQNNEFIEWQSFIWNSMIQRFPDINLHLHLASLKQLKNINTSNIKLPKRICIFGISHLDPFIKEIFLELSKIIDLHWFFLEASPIILSQVKEIKKNDLLVNYDTITDKLSSSIPTKDVKNNFKKYYGNNILSHIQNTIYHNNNNSKSISLKELRSDDSICLQNCHTIIREVEVLHDWILEQFKRNSTLYPENILVLSANLHSYAPVIKSIFDNNKRKNGLPIIPYTLQGIPKQENISYASAFFQLMELGSSRFSAKDIFNIINNPWIWKQSNVSNLELVKQYLLDGGIYRGIDNEYLKEQNYHTNSIHTFTEGLNRLFLSYAIPVDINEETISLKTVPNIEGENAVVLGIIAEVCEKLSFYANEMSKQHTLHEWVVILENMERDLLGDEFMNSSVKSLIEIQNEVNFINKIDITPVKTHLEQHYSKEGADNLFQFNGIRFANFSSMHSTPFDIICLLGMNENEFPQKENNYEFDLIINKEDIIGSSQKDRQFFLEILLSAKEKLYISYTGQSVYRSGESSEPSIIAQELCEYIDRNITIETEDSSKSKPLSHYIIKHHYMQSYNSAYFKKRSSSTWHDNYFSYSKENCLSANALLETKVSGLTLTSPFWLAYTYDAIDLGIKELKIDLEDLLRFFQDPAQYWIRNNLNFSLNYLYRKDILPEEEPYELSSLENIYFCRGIIKMLIADQNNLQIEEEVKNNPKMPSGTYGDIVKERVLEKAKEFFKELLIQTNSERIEVIKLPVALKIRENYILSGTLEGWVNIHGDLIYFAYEKLSARHRLQAWIIYLVWLCSNEKQNRGKKCYIITENKRILYDLSACNDRQSNSSFILDYLSKLITIYLEGLKQPLPFFTETSWTYIEKLMADEGEEVALIAAKNKWNESGGLSRGSEKYYRTISDSEKPYINLCFRQRNVFPVKNNIQNNLFHNFNIISSQVFGDILRYSKK